MRCNRTLYLPLAQTVTTVIAFIACCGPPSCDSYQWLDRYIETNNHTHPLRQTLVILVVCTREDYSQIQITQFEHLGDEVMILLHWCRNPEKASDSSAVQSRVRDVTLTYSALFEHIAKLADGQVVAIFEDDLLLLPYSYDWFRWCAGELRSNVDERVLAYSFFNDNAFMHKRHVNIDALSLYLISESFGGLGWMTRVDHRTREFFRDVRAKQEKQPAVPWDAQASRWHLAHKMLTVYPFVPRVRHVPHSDCRHRALLGQVVLSPRYTNVSTRVPMSNFTFAGEHCTAGIEREFSSRKEYERFHDRDPHTGGPPVVIGGKPRSFYGGVHVRIAPADDNRVTCYAFADDFFGNNYLGFKKAVIEVGNMTNVLPPPPPPANETKWSIDLRKSRQRIADIRERLLQMDQLQKRRGGDNASDHLT